MERYEEPTTCGAGLAAHAALPRKLGELTSAVAGILALHMESLELSDDNSRLEHAAYGELVKEHRSIGRQLLDLARRMEECRDLPMGTHDAAVLTGARTAEAFERFVAVEEELAALLENRLDDDRRMMLEMERSRPVARRSEWHAQAGPITAEAGFQVRELDAGTGRPRSSEEEEDERAS